MHFGPYTLQRPLAGGDSVTRFLASRPEGNGTTSRLTVDVPTPQSCRDPQFVRNFEACIGTTLSLDHARLLPPVEHGVDQGVPYLAHAYVAGRTLAQVDAWLRAEETPWPAEVVTHILHEVAMAVRYIVAQLGGWHGVVTPPKVVLSDRGEVLLDTFMVLGGWDGVDPSMSGERDPFFALVQLGDAIYGGLPPELRPDPEDPPSSIDAWLAGWAAQDPSQAAGTLAELVHDLTVRTPDLTADFDLDDDTDPSDDVPIRRRFRRTLLATGPGTPTSAETVVHVTSAEAAKPCDSVEDAPGDGAQAPGDGARATQDAVPVVPPPPPVYGVSTGEDALSTELPLSRMTIEAPAYELEWLASPASPPPGEGAASPSTRPRDFSLVWKISWVIGCVTAGVLIGLLATAMLGFGPLVASHPDGPLPEPPRTDDP